MTLSSVKALPSDPFECQTLPYTQPVLTDLPMLLTVIYLHGRFLTVLPHTQPVLTDLPMPLTVLYLHGQFLTVLPHPFTDVPTPQKPTSAGH